MLPELANAATSDATWTLLQLSGLLWLVIQVGLMAVAVPTAGLGILWGISEHLRRRQPFSRTRGRALLEAGLCLFLIGSGAYWAGTSDLPRATRDALDRAAPFAALAALGVSFAVYRWRSRSLRRRGSRRR